MDQDSAELPHEAADRLTRPFLRFIHVESLAGMALLLATAAALVLANTAASDGYARLWETEVGVRFGALDFSRSLRDWINDALMTLFFFVVALELKRELVHGELRSFRMAAFSLAGALGGMLAPAIVFLALMHDQPGRNGWGTVMATDTAFVIGSLALLGARIPASLRVFLLSLAIFDDVGAILVVAIGYGGHLRWPAVVAAAALVALVFVVARAGIRSVPVYTLLGAGLWLAFDVAGVHPTLAGVILGIMTPAREWVSSERLRAIFARFLSAPAGRRTSDDPTERADLRRAGVAAREARSPVERLELALHPWSGLVVMPIFALANAGVRISAADLARPVAGAIFVGLAAGKPLGVLAATWCAARSGLAARPQGLRWSVLAAGSLLTGIGFTMSLFVADLAFAPALLGAAKLGILSASIVAGTSGLALLVWLTSAHRSRRVPA